MTNENTMKNELHPVPQTQAQGPSGIRWLFLGLGALTLLLGGIIYSWSILKSPLSEEFGWNPTQLALNFTITICCFGIGGLISGFLSKRLSPRIRLMGSAILVFLGFFLASRVNADSIGMLYASYGILGGVGIGVLYNVTISTVGEWFPDKKGLCSGILLMCFGFSTLIFGGLAGSLIAMPDFGWRKTYVLLGTAMAVIVFIFGLVIRRPAKAAAPADSDSSISSDNRSSSDSSIPSDNRSSSDSSIPFDNSAQDNAESCAVPDLTAGQMLKTGTFWKLFIALTLLAAIGNVCLSFAKDFAIFTGSAESTAITIVGIMSVCNGLGRLFAGSIYDHMKLRKTQWVITLIMLVAPLSAILALITGGQIIGIVALLLCGFSYGLCPTTSAVYPKLFFGEKNYSLNFSIVNLTLIPTSFAATIAGAMLTATGSYMPVFLMLLAFGIIGSICLLLIRTK